MFTGGLLACQFQYCELAAPLRHVTGLPGLRLLRGLRPVAAPSDDGDPARHRPGWSAGRATGDSSHVHHTADRRGGCPAIPLQPRHGYAADLHHGLLPDEKQSGAESPVDQACTAVRPRSTRLEPARRLRGFQHWFTSAYTYPSCLPGMDHLAVPAHPVVVGAAPTVPCTSQGSAAPSFDSPLRRAEGGSFHPARLCGASWRTFSSTQSTSAASGGCKYKPTMSRTFSMN